MEEYDFSRTYTDELNFLEEGAHRMNESIGEMLKRFRRQSNMSVSDVAIQLQEKYHMQIAEKTIYGWESDQSHPTTDTFITLCEIYQINNLYDAGLKNGGREIRKEEISDVPKLHINEQERMLIEAYRQKEEMHGVLDILLDMDEESARKEKPAVQDPVGKEKPTINGNQEKEADKD